LRRGAAFVLSRTDGCVLVRSRPPAGLLGGMTEVPTSHWSSEFDERDALADAPRVAHAAPRWRRVHGCITHAFTHFPLQLVVYAATVPAGVPAPCGTRWVVLAGLAGEALPTVMRKVLAHAFSADCETASVIPAKVDRMKRRRAT
jgi:A/G-specific adenine glycosylase